MYGKLFSQMYNGTLATKGPWEALVTFQQFIILADKAGVVDMTPEAIARQTTIPLDIIKTGILALEEPDPESRTPDDEGRRISRLSSTRSWGWQITNYAKYREIRSAEERKEYHRAYWHKRKTQQNSTTQPEPTKAVSSKQEVIKPPCAFSAFWGSYPRKKSKGDAEKAWKKLSPDGALAVQILEAVERAKASADWQREGGKFIPYPATWLNAKGWEDEADIQQRAKFVI